MSNKKIKISITHWMTGSVLFEYETVDNTIKKTVEKAVKRSADLRFADLRFANLRSAKNIPNDQTNYYWHIHHETLYEWLTEPLRARINYIKSDKPKDEIELRLKLLKPVLGKIPTTEKGWERLHRLECDCGYDFKKKTIF